MLETDQAKIKEAIQEKRNANRDGEDEVGEDYCPTELDESLDQVQFKESKSSGSCHIS